MRTQFHHDVDSRYWFATPCRPRARGNSRAKISPSVLACADILVRGSESVARSQDLVRIPIVREITEPTGEGQSTLFALP
jgi:hypothetical protein